MDLLCSWPSAISRCILNNNPQNRSNAIEVFTSTQLRTSPLYRIAATRRRVIAQKKPWIEKTAPRRKQRKETNMKIRNTKGMRLAKPITSVVLAGLLGALQPSAQAQCFGGFGVATTLAGAAALAGPHPPPPPPACWR